MNNARHCSPGGKLTALLCAAPSSSRGLTLSFLKISRLPSHGSSSHVKLTSQVCVSHHRSQHLNTTRLLAMSLARTRYNNGGAAAGPARFSLDGPCPPTPDPTRRSTHAHSLVRLHLFQHSAGFTRERGRHGDCWPTGRIIRTCWDSVELSSTGPGCFSFTRNARASGYTGSQNTFQLHLSLMSKLEHIFIRLRSTHFYFLHTDTTLNIFL